MSEMVPSVLMHAQALQLLKDLMAAQKAGTIKTVAEGIEHLSDVLTKFEDNTVEPLIDYNPVSETEPPSSPKTNEFLDMAGRDINCLVQQSDISHAAVQYAHNLVATEIMRAKIDNARLTNKIKTLQMYSDSIDSNVITFGDTFKTLDFVDLEMTPDEDRVFLFGQGAVTLSPSGTILDHTPDAVVSILEDSNGFLGNNHTIEKVEDGHITLRSEVRIYDDISGLTDARPDTVIEYEKYDLDQKYIDKAGGLRKGGFLYVKTKDDGSKERIPWLGSPSDGKLKLGIQLDFEKTVDINSISYTPYGLVKNSNHPILIRVIQTSPNGTDWTPVLPTMVWSGTNVNLHTARGASNVVTGTVTWSFQTRQARYVRIYLEQPKPVNTKLGHIYWTKKNNKNKLERVNGPLPPLENPGLHNNTPSIGEKIQERESFPVTRWAIGVRDISVMQGNYADSSTLVTDPLRVGGIVDRVILTDAEFTVPSSYPTDQTWVKFYISPDEGETWHQISRIQDDFLGIPEQIAYNDPLPEAFRESGVAYYTIDRPVTTLRLKIELTRPGSQEASTPVLKSYTLKVRRR